MKKFVLLFIYVFLMLPVFAQTNFQELSLEKALEKAKGEGKMVFIDCYTSWCGPCKISFFIYDIPCHDYSNVCT